MNERKILEMRVFETANRMDLLRPDWEDGVNIIRLNIARPGNCIGGQCARAARCKEQPYLVFLEELGYSQTNAYLLGVDVDLNLAMPRAEQFKELTKFWLQEINCRLRTKQEAQKALRRQATEEAEKRLAARFAARLRHHLIGEEVGV